MIKMSFSFYGSFKFKFVLIVLKKNVISRNIIHQYIGFEKYRR